jgi:hypothetical protein
MAKAKPEATTAELVPSGPQEIGAAVPEWIPTGQPTGAENIGKEDIQMPRLAIAQALSPAKIEGKPEYIEGLKLGELYNTVTSDVYGKGPIEFVIVKVERPRWVEFDGDRNMIDPDVPANDPRTVWRTGEKGERLPPVATQFYDYVVCLMPSMEPIAISCARTGIKSAKKLNALIKMRIPPVPVYARRFVVETVLETNDKGTWGVYVFKNAGTPGVPNSDLVKTREEFEKLKFISESLQDVVVHIERDANEGDTSFDTGAMDREPAAAEPANSM